jgi:segregation and condensation protein A
VRRLLEYREFKRVADCLRGREDEWRNVFLRAGSYRPEPEDEELTDLGISMVDLFRAFRGMLEKLEDESPFRMASQEYAIEERMDFLREHCTGEDGGAFQRLLGPAPSRALLISTFLAMLELIRLREVVAAQVDRFGEIWIRVRKEEPVAP